MIGLTRGSLARGLIMETRERGARGMARMEKHPRNNGSMSEARGGCNPQERRVREEKGTQGVIRRNI